MKLVDRYIARELVTPFLFGVGAFTSIFIASQLFFKLTGYIAKGAPMGEIAALFVLRLVPMIVFTFPMAMLLAALLAFGRLSGESELIAMLSSGIPFLRTAVPVFVLGAVVSLGGLGINEWVVPIAGRTGERIERRIIEHLRASGADISAPSGNRAFVIQDTDPDGELARVVVAGRLRPPDTLTEVTLVEYEAAPGGGRRVRLLVEAERAVWEKGSSWTFYNGRTQGIIAARKASAATSDIGEAHSVEGKFDKYAFTLRKTPRQIVVERRRAQEMNYAQLGEYIANLRDQGARRKAVRELEVELYNKISIPFASMVFALVGAPLGLRRLRGGASVGLGLSVLIIFGYYTIWHGMHVLGEGGQVAPLVASWLPNMIGLVAGLFLIKRAPT
jgi:lipopolysaccharide export system permease protein